MNPVRPSSLMVVAFKDNFISLIAVLNENYQGV